MDEILKALIGAAAGNAGNASNASGQPQANDNQAIIDLLGGILGGGNSPQAQPSAAPQPTQAEANPIADLIGSILGGMAGGAETPVSPQAQPQGTGQGQAGGSIADLIGGLIGGGGGQQGSGGGIADLIGSIMGGGAGMNAQRISPMAQLLADKTGLSPVVAQAVVAFFIAKMMEFVTQRFTGAQPALPETAPQGAAPQPSGTLDLDHLLSNMHDEEAVNQHLSNSGMAQELASTTGLDEETATQSLQTLVMLMGEQKQATEAPPAQSGNLDNLLDSWEE